MLLNHSELKEFNEFDNLYSADLCRIYNHLNQFKIHCYEINDYQNLDDTIPLKGFENDSFGFAIDNRDGKFSSTSAYIVYSREICQRLQFSAEEIYACIAHEVGHIVHYFNKAIEGADSLLIERKADEIAKILGISNLLSVVLSKLINSGLYSEEQCIDMVHRKKSL